MDIIFINCIRNFIYKLLYNFKIGQKTYLHYGLRFYRPGNFSIGNNSVINRLCTLDNRGKITIGNGVSISRSVSLFTAGHFHDSEFKIKIGEITILDYCVIYSNVIICPNVRLGRGVIVYPGSVVYKGDYPDGAVLMGNPAAIFKMRNISPRTHDYPYIYAM